MKKKKINTRYHQAYTEYRDNCTSRYSIKKLQ